MTAVVLRPLGDARYAVLRNGVDTGALVWGTYWGWEVRASSTEILHGERSFRRVSQAREWLDSPDGQEFLNELAAEVTR